MRCENCRKEKSEIISYPIYYGNKRFSNTEQVGSDYIKTTHYLLHTSPISIYICNACLTGLVVWHRILGGFASLLIFGGIVFMIASIISGDFSIFTLLTIFLFCEVLYLSPYFKNSKVIGAIKAKKIAIKRMALLGFDSVFTESEYDALNKKEKII